MRWQKEDSTSIPCCQVLHTVLHTVLKSKRPTHRQSIFKTTRHCQLLGKGSCPTDPLFTTALLCFLATKSPDTTQFSLPTRFYAAPCCENCLMTAMKKVATPRKNSNNKRLQRKRRDSHWCRPGRKNPWWEEKVEGKPFLTDTWGNVFPLS